ncbi:MAG: type III-B CRISPR module RAMP protein Cmr6 [Syntrophomonadaceae bacterium]|nr:type III-B CRISPR module RAMP protein Cmr6 [Syntrophomonadaceae bacterium]
MPQPNIGYLFNKDYYSYDYFNLDIDSAQLGKEIIEKNRQILERKLSEYNDLQDRLNTPGIYKLDFKTTYPGLLIGAGYNHEVGEFGGSNANDSNNDPSNTILKLGFYFDYTSGLPAIPGSAVKGILRSAFDHNDYIDELLKQLNIHDKSIEDIGNIKKEIFDGEADGKNLSIYKRDIFYDARIGYVDGVQNNFLGDDYITPHYPNLLKNPKPIKFLKVLPGVVWRFSFDLRDSSNKVKGLLAEQKLRLFRKIVCDLGVGAKTNLGYGYFDSEYGVKQMMENIKLIKENKENMLLANKSELERRLYFLGQKPWSSELEQDLTALCQELEAMELHDRQSTAIFLKETWIKNDKWHGKQSQKQSKKIVKVKQILSEA